MHKPLLSFTILLFSGAMAVAQQMPTPTNADPIVPQLPTISTFPIRKPAAVLHHAMHLPFGDKVVKYARHLVGVRYVWGGSSPASGFDCSGFVRSFIAGDPKVGPRKFRPEDFRARIEDISALGFDRSGPVAIRCARRQADPQGEHGGPRDKPV